MSKEIYPYIFQPVYKDYIWGGTRIGEEFGRPNVGRCAESWEIAANADGDTAIANGPCRGTPFAVMLREHGPRILGPGAAGGTPEAGSFPLLIKLIDASQRLSVQVHPDEQSAAITGGEPKTEMWYVLDALPGARIFAGLKTGIDRNVFMEVMERKQLERILVSLPVTPGQAVYIPGGRVHAIGEGCLLLEIQQNSNTTYRVYDWDRRDANGLARELHVNQALQCIKWKDSPARLVSPRFKARRSINQRSDIIQSPFFSTALLRLGRPMRVQCTGKGFHAFFVTSGAIDLEHPDGSERIPRGTSFLIPAALSQYRMIPLLPDTRLIRITA